ncbi:hypothetical protein BGE01nite_37750 [Brevifollis gellanilyticus]|uniref:DUF2007 domain-containing protein n=2 Tax=Brevifollis gellanilyticus TaxID=748831 RepID=A0A512MCL5_9BACT|nr:hypothetical protein BGE01nite_37750 [Brevifollis gellanilyticus]
MADQACIDAGYLCSMGVEAVLVQDPGEGGTLPGVLGAPHRLEVPQAQMERAAALLSQRSAAEAAPVLAPVSVPVDAAGLHRFLRFILIYDVICYVAFAVYWQWLNPEPPPAVLEFLDSLTLSVYLWQWAYVSHWPLVMTGLVANVLCYFYHPFGRMLFAAVMIWGHVTLLGPPPMIFSPFEGFFGCLQSTLASMALALMYWSPLRERFTTSHSPRA